MRACCECPWWHTCQTRGWGRTSHIKVDFFPAAIRKSIYRFVETKWTTYIYENLYGFVENYLPILEIISRHGEYWINVFWHPWLPLLVSCGLYGLLAGVLRWHLRANTRSSLGPSFEHAQSCLRAICTCVHTCGWDPCEVHAKCWTFRRQKLYPVTCSQGFSGLTQPCLLWGTISIICGISL